MDTDIQRYARTMPEYREPLTFLQNILDFQATLAEKVEADLRIEPARAREKWHNGQVLLAGESLSLPAALFREALVDLRSWLPPEGPARETLNQLLASVSMAPATAEVWLADVIADSVKYSRGDMDLQWLANATSTDPAMLAFLLRVVLSPVFQKQAAPYQVWVETAPWRRGSCPVCGSQPGMARLTCDNGQRILVCPLCCTEWAFDRLRCPFCEEDNQPRLRYFTVGDDQEHRIDCCDRCQRYVKTVDERVLGRRANLPAEDVITAHLDVLARDQGYQ
jgi:FdhE protein